MTNRGSASNRSASNGSSVTNRGSASVYSMSKTLGPDHLCEWLNTVFTASKAEVI